MLYGLLLDVGQHPMHHACVMKVGHDCSEPSDASLSARDLEVALAPKYPLMKPLWSFIEDM